MIPAEFTGDLGLLTQKTIMPRPSLIALSTLLLHSFLCLPGRAERAPDQREDATYVFTGIVEQVYVRISAANRHYVVQIAIDEVHRGDLKPGDTFFATCFQRKRTAPPMPAAYGHTIVPAEGDRIKAFVMRRGGSNEGVYKDWVDILEPGQANQTAKSGFSLVLGGLLAGVAIVVFVSLVARRGRSDAEHERVSPE